MHRAAIIKRAFDYLQYIAHAITRVYCKRPIRIRASTIEPVLLYIYTAGKMKNRYKAYFIPSPAVGNAQLYKSHLHVGYLHYAVTDNNALKCFRANIEHILESLLESTKWIGRKRAHNGSSFKRKTKFRPCFVLRTAVAIRECRK